MIIPSQKIQSLPPYAFAEMDRLVGQLKNQGVDVIDFGTGDPRDETPKFVRDAATEAIEEYKSAGYPSYIGLPEFRITIAAWYKRRFNVELNPDTEITSTVGSKEGIFNFPQAFINPGDVVIMPTPGYPPYSRGTLFAGGQSFLYPLLEENNFYPDFSKIPAEVVKRAKILWLCYPNSPTGKLATKKFYETAVDFCESHNIILASDECYIDLYFKEKAISALEISKKGVVAFHSLSKRNNMTGYRVGFVCGDSEIINAFKKLKTNIDSGTPNFMQAAAIAALNDDRHSEEMRQKYNRRRELIFEGLRKIGLRVLEPEGTFYIWQRVPDGYDSISFAKRLLEKDCAIAVTPGEWISDTIADGTNPGKYYVRFALVEDEKRVAEASQRLAKLKL
ncbi:aminotransferase class I/II-fold pyridoxal phosphate-dependent enzyme [Candidatus Peregrinibacteria bacterium]|nr:aminotransferase class I/II-fold pyridoxal phosphate-dependent enzyme [Candidatus Peregrinibacteria bacterium]